MKHRKTVKPVGKKVEIYDPEAPERVAKRWVRKYNKVVRENEKFKQKMQRRNNED